MTKNDKRLLAFGGFLAIFLGWCASVRYEQGRAFKAGQDVAWASAPSRAIGYQCDPQSSPPFLSGKAGYYFDNSTPSEPVVQFSDTVQGYVVAVSPSPVPSPGQIVTYSGANGRYALAPPGANGTTLVFDNTKPSGVAATTSPPVVTNVYNGSLWWSPVQNALVATVGTNASTQTNGVMFIALQPMTIIGLNVVYPDNTPRSVKFSLWRCIDNSNCVGVNSTRVATTTQTVATSGFHTYAFTAPYSLGTGDTYRRFMIAYSVVGGGFYWRFNNTNAAPGGAILQSASTSPATCAAMGGPAICWVGFGCWAGTEDTPPTNGPNTEYNPIEPVFTVP